MLYMVTHACLRKSALRNARVSLIGYLKGLYTLGSSLFDFYDGIFRFIDVGARRGCLEPISLCTSHAPELPTE